jgi:hypothetical protein
MRACIIETAQHAKQVSVRVASILRTSVVNYECTQHTKLRVCKDTCDDDVSCQSVGDCRSRVSRSLRSSLVTLSCLRGLESLQVSLGTTLLIMALR